MAGELVRFPGVTRLDTDPTLVLKEAIESGKLKNVVIMGYDEDEEEYFASSIADGGTVIWLMERLKLQLLRFADKED